jgi:hypothetical protein
MEEEPITAEQRKRIFGLARALGMKSDAVAALTRSITGLGVDDGRTGVSKLNWRQANECIVRLGGTPHARQEISRRTEQRRRQKTGVPALASAAQLTLIASLAQRRGITPDGLRRLCQRQLKGKERPTTSREANALIEALKSMNARTPRA